MNSGKFESELEKQWIVRILESEIWLERPRVYRRPNNWKSWGQMQARLLESIKDKWQESHVYIRVYSYEIDYYTNVLKSGTYEIVSGIRKGEYLLYIPDCRDTMTIESVLSSAGFVPLAKTIYIMKMNLPRWHETINELFEIAVKLSKGHRVKEFESQLSNCHCLCYTMDEDLIIAKLDLDEDHLLPILESVAQEESLDLVVIRDNKN